MSPALAPIGAKGDYKRESTLARLLGSGMLFYRADSLYD